MNIRCFQAFVVVADELNLTRAAARLQTSQPSMTRRILEFERRLGVRLFVRHTRGVSLTREGRELVEQARKVQDAADCFFQAAQRTGRQSA